MHRSMLLIPLIAAAPALADIELKYSDDTTILVRDDRVRLGDTESYMLFEKGKETFLIVDNNEKTYMEITENFMSDLTSSMNAQLEQMLSELPPEQREMYRESMEAMMPSPSRKNEVQMSVRATGEKDEVAGFSCREAVVSYGGTNAAFDQSLCVADPDDLGMSDDDLAMMTAAMKSISGIVGYDEESSFMDLEELGGVPVRSASDDVGIDSELVSVSNDSIDAERFEVPDGYRKVSIEEGMRMGE